MRRTTASMTVQHAFIQSFCILKSNFSVGFDRH
jgi:hypothetical protein